MKLKSGEKLELKMGGHISNKGKVLRETPLINRKIHKNDKARYLEIMDKFGITPKFPRFVAHENYMKLVRDAAREPMNQQVVDVTKIDWDAAAKMSDDWVKSGAYELETKADPRLLNGVRKRLEQGALPESPVIKAGHAESIEEIINTGKKLRASQRKAAKIELDQIQPKGLPVAQRPEAEQKAVGKRANIEIKPKKKRK